MDSLHYIEDQNLLPGR